MKTTCCITIDIELRQKAKILGINVSNLINNVLRGIVSNSDDEGIDIVKVHQELNEVRDQISNLKAKEQELMAQCISFDEKMKKEEKEKWATLKQFMDGFKANNPLRDI